VSSVLTVAEIPEPSGIVRQALETDDGILGRGVGLAIDQESNGLVPAPRRLGRHPHNRRRLAQPATANAEPDRTQFNGLSQEPVAEVLGGDKLPADIPTQIDDQTRTRFGKIEGFV